MPRRTLGGVAGALLVADEDVAHRLIVHQRVVDRHDGAAGQAEDVGDPEQSRERTTAWAPVTGAAAPRAGGRGTAAVSRT
jgi:hypothetical protein